MSVWADFVHGHWYTQELGFILYFFQDFESPPNKNSKWSWYF